MNRATTTLAGVRRTEPNLPEAKLRQEAWGRPTDNQKEFSKVVTKSRTLVNGPRVARGDFLVESITCRVASCWPLSCMFTADGKCTSDSGGMEDMEMTRKLLIFAVVAAFAAIAAFGAPINPLNTRPVIIGSAPTGEGSLQSILNSIYGCTDCIDANNNQSSFGEWTLPGTDPQQTAPILQATYAADGDAVGIWSGTDSTSLTDRLIFTATAVKGAGADIYFNGDGTVTISGSGPDGTCGTDVNCGTFAGINQAAFGFYLDNTTTGALYYTADSLNSPTTPSPNSPDEFPAGYTTQARAVAYDQASTDKWTIAFEDGTDFDYNDRVISVESIVGVPEPAAIFLLGTVALLCGSIIRRRKRIA